MRTKLEIARNWLPRYTGTKMDDFGDYIYIIGKKPAAEKELS